MALLHISLALTVLATIIQFIGIMLPCWMIFTSTFSKDVQIGIYNFCIDFKDCRSFTEVDFKEFGLDFSLLPKEFEHLFGQLIIREYFVLCRSQYPKIGKTGVNRNMALVDTLHFATR